VTEATKKARAVAAIVQRVFPKGFRQRIARRRGYHGDAEVGANSLTEGGGALSPLRWCFAGLIDGAQDGRAGEQIRAEGVKKGSCGAWFFPTGDGTSDRARVA
jgi:hypothetical protein